MMKKFIYLLIAVVLLSSCATGSKTKPVSNSDKVEIAAPVPPAGITFTKITNYKSFASIQMPFAGSKFSKQESGGAKNDAGEPVPTAKYGGYHIGIDSDIAHMIKDDGDASDINVALEGIKGSYYLRSMMKKDTLVEEYSDVEIGGKLCKKVFVYYKYISDNWSSATYTLGYIIPHHDTTAFLFIDKAQSELPDFDADVAIIDSALKYMAKTVEFK